MENKESSFSLMEIKDITSNNTFLQLHRTGVLVDAKFTLSRAEENELFLLLLSRQTKKFDVNQYGHFFSYNWLEKIELILANMEEYQMAKHVNEIKEVVAAINDVTRSGKKLTKKLTREIIKQMAE